MEKHEFSKIDFELIDDAFKALLKSDPDPMVADISPTCGISFATPSPAGWRSNRPRKANGC
jgi:hypothetical protein